MYTVFTQGIQSSGPAELFDEATAFRGIKVGESKVNKNPLKIKISGNASALSPVIRELMYIYAGSSPPIDVIIL